MRTVDDLEVSYAQLGRAQIEAKRGLLDRLEHYKLPIILIAVALAFCARAYHLGAASLAEDEANKLFAIRVYEQGDFTVNAEHPMVMKMLCYASLHAVDAWNDSLGDKLGLAISEEAALRLPNALFGALTVIPVFLLTSALLGFRVGLLAALFWAFGLNAIWFNRVVKEDTLLVFFMFMAFHLYLRAKQVPDHDTRLQDRYFMLAGAAFGLMMASKFFPHYFGLYALFFHLGGYDSRNNRPIPARANKKFFATMLLAFVAFNPAAFVPQTWRYVWKYVNEELLTHHGYLVMGGLYPNDMAQTPGGPPWYYYFVFLGVKVPLPLVIAFAAGLVEIFRRRGTYPRSRGYLFLRIMLVFWLFPMAIAGTKFLRYTLTLMPFFYMTAAVGTVVLWRLLSSSLGRLAIRREAARMVAAAAIIVLFVAAPAATMVGSLPYPNLYLNKLGGDRTGFFFPHDEFYDIGARESIRYVADVAPVGARLASEIPGVVEYYLERYNRKDIQIEIMSKPDFNLLLSAPDYALLQTGRIYFENHDNFRFIEKNYPLVQSSTFRGAAATEVYEISGPVRSAMK
jgi:Dolichyl-phosphate-mannose-protein mannosyltransferase